MTTADTHLDRLMRELGLANHQLAAQVGTSRQAIYKLRSGITRMLPDWAKRIAPHLGVHWQELVDGAPSPAEQARVELMAAYEAMTDEQRRALLIVAKGMAVPATPMGAIAESMPRRRAVPCQMNVRQLRAAE